MRHNQTFAGYEELHRLTVEALEESGKSQADVAREMDKTRGAISRALKGPDSSLSGLQRDIIEHLTPYQVDEEVQFTLKRKDRSS